MTVDNIGLGFDLVGGVVRLLEAEFGHLTDPLFAHGRHVDAGGEGVEGDVGADIARRALAADVLFAGAQGHDEGALAVGVGGLADEAARHLPDMLLAGGEEPDMRPAEIECVADRLSLRGNDVGAHRAGRLDRAERDDLADGGA